MELKTTNRLKRKLHERHKYIKLKSIGNRYKIKAEEVQKLKQIKKEESDNNQDNIDSLLPNLFNDSSDNHQLLYSIDHELADIKKLLSFLVQQNEQSRLQQKNMKEQNEKLLEEIDELKQTLNEMKQEQDEEYEKEYHSYNTVYKTLLYIKEKVNTISSKIDDKKLKGNWQKIFEK